MRQYKKNKCIKLLNSLNKAHGEIMSYILHKNMDEAAALIAKCQQAAITIGTMLEEAGDECKGTVSVLEQYCEELYLLHSSIANGEKFSTNSAQKSLSKILEKAGSKIRNDISTELEVLFLPYKAAMWDSLESVWEKYRSMPGCNASVVPIPYFDRDEKGELKDMHYEAELYPANVQVISYSEYDFEGIHPDKIFIHNPYDDMNYVTSVHPFFYTENIKKFTDELVYIPYFVLGEPRDPYNEKYLESMEHFVLVPGVKNADKVIVQSEKMKQAYVNVLTKYYTDHDRKYWEKKIEGSGSPKLERVNNLKEEDYEIPDEWKNKIYDSDGKRKKIIFYNTSVAAMLKHPEEMMKKIEDSLEIFKESKDIVTLLWRPHPLYKSTMEAMIPQMCPVYQEIVDKYIEEDWGIYDESPDIDRAIALCDAYYGDPSSVVQLCQNAGKPVMIQNVEILSSETG